jgi:formyltetrahydrofolate deformylase
MPSGQTFTLTGSCPDRVGIVAAVSQFIADRGGWIVESSQHSDAASKRFYMRHVVLMHSLSGSLESFAGEFESVADRFRMTWALRASTPRRRVVVMVSKFDHCLADLLYRWRAGDLPCDIPCVISNHPDLRQYVEWHGIAFHHVPVTPETKPQAFAEVERLFVENGADTLVLARYMQVLSPELCRRYPGRIINIHHSFLPSFVGAKPYHQAFERGVKLIGATGHYVTESLDQGPIIDQDVVRVDHGDTVEDLVRYGRDVERAVLARALKYHLEDRVLLDGNRTIVFR